MLGARNGKMKYKVSRYRVSEDHVISTDVLANSKEDNVFPLQNNAITVKFK